MLFICMDSDSKRSNDKNQDWLPCRPGTFADPSLSFSTRIAKRKPHLFSLGLIYVCGALIFGEIILSWTSRPIRGEVNASGVINCIQVRHHLDDYSAMNIRDCKLRASISTHLSRCQECDLIYQELAGNVIVQRSSNRQCDYPQAPDCDAQE
jgi:hypothetical protein